MFGLVWISIWWSIEYVLYNTKRLYILKILPDQLETQFIYLNFGKINGGNKALKNLYLHWKLLETLRVLYTFKKSFTFKFKLLFSLNIWNSCKHGFDLKMTDKKFNFAEKNQLDKTDRCIKKNMSPCLFKLGTSGAMSIVWNRWRWIPKTVIINRFYNGLNSPWIVKKSKLKGCHFIKK